MEHNAPLPTKEDLPKQLWDVATTLTPEAQNASLKKAKDLGFDIQRGRIPLEETLINLNHAREVLLDAVDKAKLAQLPLKLQYSLLAQTQRVSQALTSLVNGTDTVLALEDSVDDLTSSIWQYNLQNLSGEVLGFTQKMNQLKAQETLIRQVSRQAEAFVGLQEQAQKIAQRLEEMNVKAEESSKALFEASDQTSLILAETRKGEEAAQSSLAAIEAIKTSVSSDLRSCEDMNSTISSLLTESEKAKEEIDETKRNFATLLEESSKQFEEINGRTDALLLKLQSDYDETAAGIKAGVDQVSKELHDSITDLRETTSEQLRTTALGLDNSVKKLRDEVSDLVTSTSGRMETAEDNHAKTLKQALDSFEDQGALKLIEVSTDFLKKAAEVEAEARKSVADNDSELHRLTAELDKLESQIRDSIERATGHSLFHSFQKRQESLAGAKRFWAWALAGAVAVSLTASGFFIYSLRFVHIYDAAFYLKLSISLPIIYAIGFCSVQYSRERRLEEEYAFKSSISISLDPYQRLVRGLVDADKPDELAKYTAFVIDSVNRVFTSPTEHIFDEHRRGKGSSPEKLLKGLRELLEPILAVVKK
jgi:hypothetical protein